MELGIPEYSLNIQEEVTETAPKTTKVFCENLCLFYCYAYCAGLLYKWPEDAYDEAEYQRLKGNLGADGYVKDADKLLQSLTTRYARVEKKKISSLAEIKDDTPVCYQYGNKSHWVVARNGEIVFNSLKHSVCVEKGVPVSARIIHWTEK